MADRGRGSAKGHYEVIGGSACANQLENVIENLLITLNARVMPGARLSWSRNRVAVAESSQGKRPQVARSTWDGIGKDFRP